MKIGHILQAMADMVRPRLCPVCGKVLDGAERYICRHCLMRMPITQFEEVPFNIMVQRFAGKVPVDRATAGFFYERQSPYSQILQDIKYRNVPNMARWLAKKFAERIAYTGFWNGVDYLIPVPLHITKKAKRGYNQAEYIALGISDATQIPIYEAIDAVKGHNTQTHKTAHERWLNTIGIFAPIPETSSTLVDKHVIIIDDVITTGATLLNCAECISGISGIRISFFTLAAARLT